MAARRMHTPGLDHRDADNPVLWFALLERARRTGDPSLDRRARRALSRAGIRVTYDSQPIAAREPLPRADLELLATRVAALLRGSGP